MPDRGGTPRLNAFAHSDERSPRTGAWGISMGVGKMSTPVGKLGPGLRSQWVSGGIDSEIGLGTPGEPDRAIRQPLMGETRGMRQPVMMGTQQDAVLEVRSTTD